MTEVNLRDDNKVVIKATLEFNIEITPDGYQIIADTRPESLLACMLITKESLSAAKRGYINSKKKDQANNITKVEYQITKHAQQLYNVILQQKLKEESEPIKEPNLTVVPDEEVKE